MNRRSCAFVTTSSMVTALAVVLQTSVGIPPLLTDHSLRIPPYLIPVFYKIQFQFPLLFPHNFLKMRSRTEHGAIICRHRRRTAVTAGMACFCVRSRGQKFRTRLDDRENYTNCYQTKNRLRTVAGCVRFPNRRSPITCCCGEYIL